MFHLIGAPIRVIILMDDQLGAGRRHSEPRLNDDDAALHSAQR